MHLYRYVLLYSYKYLKRCYMSKTRINTTIDSDLWKEIKKYAIDKDSKVNEILETLIREFLNNNKK